MRGRKPELAAGRAAGRPSKILTAQGKNNWLAPRVATQNCVSVARCDSRGMPPSPSHSNRYLLARTAI
jgi:hypothetical protein